MGDFERSDSEQLIDLHVYIVPPDLWRTNLRSAVNQIIDETISAGFIRVHPETSVNALRKELEIQLEYDASDYPMPAEYVFLKCVGRCLTQVKPRQEYTLKVKNFQLPTTLAAEIYILDAVAAGVRYTPYSGSSSQSSSVRYNGTPRSDRSEFSGHKPIPPIRRSNISTQTNGPGLSDEEQQKLDELLRQKTRTSHRRKREEEEEEERKRREWEEEQERKRREEEERQQYGDDDDEDEEERRRRDEELRLEEERRRLEEERRRQEEERRRLEEERRRQEEEEEERRNRESKRRTPGGRSLSELRQELEKVRQERLDAERRREELVKKARLLQNKAQQRRNQARDLWKKKYFEEKKRTAPLEEQCNKLRSELESLHRKIMAQLENNKETFRRPGDNKPSQQPQPTSNLRMQAARLQHEIDDIQRRVENVKMKLTTEMKLKNQAEGELKALRAELTQKKINMTLARSQPYTPVPMLTPRS